MNSPGIGTRYRAFADGPGVTPMVEWVGPPPGNYGASAGLTRPELAVYSMNLNGPRKPFNAVAVRHPLERAAAPVQHGRLLPDSLVAPSVDFSGS